MSTQDIRKISGSHDYFLQFVDKNNSTVFAVDSSGEVTVGSAAVATSATSGSSGTLPAQAAGYLILNVGNTKFKIPYFNV